MNRVEKEIFVPGRNCLFGEHSDWAAGYREYNPSIEKGQAIVVPTNQGIYAKAKLLDEPTFRFISKPFNEEIEIPLNNQSLREIYLGESVFSYIAGVAQEIISSYKNNEKGIEICNYKTDLPIKKGLSSSAAISVLTAIAFDALFGLNWTPKRTMEIAYLGERMTGSKCGKLDQICYYNHSMFVEFDEADLSLEKLPVGKDISCLVVDLMSQKDTKKILSDLTNGFPFPSTEIEKKKHEYFNKINPKIISEARTALSLGNAEKLGALMNLAQEKFDEYLAPACPQELTAPILHKVLNDPELNPYVYGGKGIGSGGDGTCQFVCKDEKSKENAKEILKRKGYDCFDLNILKS